jgi:hypothetical protein
MAKLKVWKFLSVCMVLVLMVGLGVGLAPATSAKAATTPVGSWTDVSMATGEKPLQFTSGGHVLGFSSDGVIIASADHMLKTEFIGSRAVSPEADAEALAENNAGMASPLSRVTYHDVWDGVTAVYEASPGAIVESTYYVNATEKGMPYDLIRLGYNRPVSLDEQGNLVIAYDSGIFVESAPVAWQEIDGQRQPVTAAFALYGEREVGFSLGDYVPGIPVVIDPDLIWNTFLGGGGGTDNGNAIAVDGSGNVYVAGYSNAPWGSPVHAYDSNGDAFAARLNSSGNLIWNTFLGGSGPDYGYSIALDGSGNVYVAGQSSGVGWGSPVQGHQGATDAFVARLNSSGNLIWNTFLGGLGWDGGPAIAVDGSGNIYVAGRSNDTWGAPLQAHNAPGVNYDGWAARLNSSGNLIWNTFLGGSGGDSGHGIAVDGGNVYVAGESDDTWGSPVRTHFGVANYDAFVARLNGSGTLIWNTFLGGSGHDRVYGNNIAVDGSGNVYVAGYSNVTWGSPVRAHNPLGTSDAFAARLNSSGNLIWNTFLGGSGPDGGYAIAVDGGGNVYVTGESSDTWGSPVRAHTEGVNLDAFAAGLDSSGALIWNTFLGGSGLDYGYGIAVDGSGNVYVAGESSATWGTPVRAYSSSVPEDAFAAKISGPPPPEPEPELPVPPTLRVSSQPPPPHLPPGDVRLNGITVSSSETQPGQPVTVLANLVNSGASTGSYNVALSINGKVEQQRTVEVSPGTAYPVKFTVTKSEPGTYEVAIEGQRASFTVVGEGTSGAPASSGLIALIVIAVLILATAVVLTMTFRRPA